MINLWDLNAARRKRYEKYKKIFSIVLDKCHQKIMATGSQMQTECIFEIPKYIPGMPLFDNKECMMYVLTQIKQNGFRVQVLTHTSIYISWQHIDLYAKNSTNKRVKKTQKTATTKTRNKNNQKEYRSIPDTSSSSFSSSILYNLSKYKEQKNKIFM